MSTIEVLINKFSDFDDKVFLSAKDVAVIMGVSVPTIRRWKIPTLDLSPTYKVYTREIIQSFIERKFLEKK